MIHHMIMLLQLNIFSFTGINNACSVHEWNGTFGHESVHFLMTSVCGHVMSLDFISKYNNWDRVDPVRKSVCVFNIIIMYVKL
jgi:hypothetical protein